MSANSRLTLGEFLIKFRACLGARAGEAIFVFVDDGVLAPMSTLISSLYNCYRDSDGILYMTYAAENTFGTDVVDADGDGRGVGMGMEMGTGKAEYG